MGGSVVDRGSVFGRRPGQTPRQNQVTLSHIHLSASVRLPAPVQKELSFGRRWGNQQIHSAGGVKKKKEGPVGTRGRDSEGESCSMRLAGGGNGVRGG